MGDIVLIRHGQTEWSAGGRHTSRTDIDLTPQGEHQAIALAAALAGRTFHAVLCSPRRRALRTAELADLTVTSVDDDLAEWDYGQYEGLTTVEIHRDRPDWWLWTDGCPDGESPTDVGARADRLLVRARKHLDEADADDVALVAHGHVLRVVGARWIGLPVSAAGLLRLDTATVSELGFEHDRPVIDRWNVPVG